MQFEISFELHQLSNQRSIMIINLKGITLCQTHISSALML